MSGLLQLKKFFAYSRFAHLLLFSRFPYPCMHTEEYHVALLESRPSVVDFIERFLNSGEANFVHIALWILAQFSGGGMIVMCVYVVFFVSVTNLLALQTVCVHSMKYSILGLGTSSFPTRSGKNTRELLRRSSLFTLVEQLKTSRNSIEVTQLAETAFNNLKVSFISLHEVNIYMYTA